MLPEAAIFKLARNFKLYQMIALLFSYWQKQFNENMILIFGRDRSKTGAKT